MCRFFLYVYTFLLCNSCYVLCLCQFFETRKKVRPFSKLPYKTENSLKIRHPKSLPLRKFIFYVSNKKKRRKHNTYTLRTVWWFQLYPLKFHFANISTFNSTKNTEKNTRWILVKVFHQWKKKPQPKHWKLILNS